MKYLICTVLSLSLLAGADVLAEPQGITVTTGDSQPWTKGSAQFFTGSVWIAGQFKGTDGARVSGGVVTFEPGARTAWHTHPLGQTLIVTAGVGRVQQEGQPVQTIRAGDRVWIAPHVKHWHGAAPTSGMTHVAVVEALDGKTADWMEQVSDQQYNAH
ncbi:cupin domain-containing protein [Pseudomonas fluorescens]|uniref:(R)-mandelonitrile lyase n=1 Tax=Pseudomonas fluorescens TaxID=294 RepID=UPI0037497D72